MKLAYSPKSPYLLISCQALYMYDDDLEYLSPFTFSQFYYFLEFYILFEHLEFSHRSLSSVRKSRCIET